MTEIYLIRHGEAEGNVFRRLHGQYDSLLMPLGHRQADCVKRRFADIRIDACFSSDLTRASLTAQAIYVPKGLSLHRDPVFREVDVGAWEDLPYGYLDHFEPEQMWNFNHNPPIWRAEGAETFDTYTQRFLAGMERAAQAYDGGTIAIFSHGAVIRGTLLRLFYWGRPEDLPYSDNAGVSKLRYDHGTFTADFLNDNSHLPQELSTFARQKWWRAGGQRTSINLYYQPLTGAAPKGLTLPEQAAELCLVGILGDAPVAVVSLGKAQAAVGTILGMDVLPEQAGKGFSDQLLGCAFSHFRRLGCDALEAAPGRYPDDILNRYGFDPQTRRRNISTKCYTWGDDRAQI